MIASWVTLTLALALTLVWAARTTFSDNVETVASQTSEQASVTSVRV